MQLQELQRAFQARVLERRPGIEAQLAASEAADFAERLAVYSDGYRSRLLEALGTTYSALKTVLGDAEFAAAMMRFVDAEPSRYHSIRFYGERVAPYVTRGRDPATVRTLDDLVRWEWLLADVFDAADDVASTPGELAAIPPESWPGVSFALRLSLRLTVIRSNALQWWRSAQSDAEQRPAAFECAPPVTWLLWRRGTRTLFRSLDPVEAQAFEAVRAGATFGVLCELLAGLVTEAEAPARAVATLQTWFAEELIARVVLPADDPV